MGVRSAIQTAWRHQLRVKQGRVGLVSLGFLTSLGLFLAPLAPRPALSAETIYVSYGPLNFSLSVDALATFAESGEITPEFRFYARLIKPKQREELRQLLQRRFKVSPVAVSQMTYTPLAEAALKRLGLAIQTEARVEGFNAIRAALILAATNPDGLTVIDVLRRFPTRGIRIDAEVLLDLRGQLTTFFNYRDAAIAAIDQQTTTEAPSQLASSVAQQMDLRAPGPFKVDQRTLNFTESRNQRSLTGEKLDQPFEVEVLLPQGVTQPVPVVVFSHGLGAYRTRVLWLLEHLASHGFAVVAPEHVGSNLRRREEVLRGLLSSDIAPIEFLNRPLDIKVALDELERLSQTDPAWKGRLDLQRVGVIGNSLGGQTALSVAGAELNRPRLRQVCAKNEPSLNLSTLLQCLADQAPSLNVSARDPRIKAAIALHPPSSVIFGPESLSQIQVPTMILAGSGDILAPVNSEQIYPFIWLTTPEKYLALLVPSGHIFADAADNLSPALNLLLGGPEPERKRDITEALSVAFMQVYLNDRPEFRNYLTTGYAQSLSSEALRLDLIRSLSADQINQNFGGPPPRPIVPALQPESRR